MKLYERVEQIVLSQFQSSRTDAEKVHSISRLMSIEIDVIATNFALYMRNHPNELPSDLFYDFIENELQQMLGNK